MSDVIVIGAGLSGLSCAWELRRRGVETVVLESGEEPGGVVRSRRVGGCLVECGPNSILPTEGALSMIRAAGLEEERVAAAKRLPRWVYVGGRLRRVPWVLSLSGGIRALMEPFVRRRPGEGDESLEAFFTRRFGREVHDRLAAPFVGGIYAGDTRELGMEGAFGKVAALERDFGSVLLGALRSGRSSPPARLSSFRQGMGALPRALAAGLDIRYGIPVERIGADQGRWVAQAAGVSFAGQVLVCAAPAFRARGLFGDTGLGELLGEVVYAPVLVAAAALGREQLASPLWGFGFLAPRSEGLRILGSLYSSSVFPDRAPPGRALLTTFIGGRLDPESIDWPDERVWRTVEEELRVVLGFRGAIEPLALFRYPQGIPQYRVGHGAWRAQLRARMIDMPGCFLTGNYLDGVSAPLAMEHGQRTATEVCRYLEQPA
jgi:oxygen-dependent protoporphyrinogen oxidase